MITSPQLVSLCYILLYLTHFVSSNELLVQTVSQLFQLPLCPSLFFLCLSQQLWQLSHPCQLEGIGANLLGGRVPLCHSLALDL